LLSFAEQDSNLAISLAFNKIEHSAKCDFNLFNFLQVKLYLNGRLSHTLDDSKQCKPRTNPEKVKIGKLPKRCRLIPWKSRLCMICNSLTSVHSTQLGNSVPKLTFSEFKIFLLHNWKKISSLSNVPK